MIVTVVVGFCGLVLGYLLAAYFIARDPEVVRLNPDEVIVKRPADGLILVAVTQQVARRIVLQNNPKKSALEARDLVVE